jgi:hypothetical protein
MAACGQADQAETLPHSGGDSQLERTYAVAKWDTVWRVGGDAQDSTLFKPFLVAASEDMVYLYDAGVQRLTALSAVDGSIRWTFGRAGAGPDEFRGVRDIKAVPGGGVAILDPRNNRIVELDAAGAVRRRIPIESVGHAEQLVPIENDRFVLLTMTPDSAFAVLDAGGRVVDRMSLPWAGFAKLDPIARQGYLAGRGGQWVFGFSFGDGWFAFDDVSPRSFTGRYLEHTEFPELETTGQGATKMAEYSSCSACSIAFSDSLVFVHFGGYGNTPKAIVDRFRFVDGKYLGSYQLPLRATVVEVDQDRVYALAEDPYPVLLALRPRT